MKNIYKKYSRFLRFLIVGASSTLIDFLLYMLLSNSLDLMLSKLISMSLASVYSFFVNRKWTFESNDSSIKTKALFFCVVIINILVNTFTNSIMYYITGNKIISFCVATGVAMFVNYFLQKIVVFKKGGD